MTMAEEKAQSAGTATLESPGENTVEVVFLPEGKTVQFENGKLPYKDHGKPQSLLDVALNNDIFLDHACGGNCACTTCHVQHLMLRRTGPTVRCEKPMSGTHCARLPC